MFESKVFKICLLISTSFILSTKADCNIRVDGDAPIFSKKIGTKTLIIRNGQKNFELKRGETIRADCPRQMSMRDSGGSELFTGQSYITALSLKCGWYSSYGVDRFYYTTSESQSFSSSPLSTSSINLKCIQGKRQLYESNQTLANCKSYTSYVIGTQSIWRDPIISASVCFDLNNLAVKYVKYLPNRADYEILSPKKNTPPQNIVLSTPIEGFEILFKGSQTIDANIKTFKERNPLLELHEFKYLSLLQNSTISAEIADFDYIFKIIWWNNLRLGNWKYFLDALKLRTEIDSYEIYTGTSGVMSIPSSSECKQLEEFAVQHESREVRAPGIIWAYLKSIKENKSEEFVIVAHNSPFYSANNSTKFCNDMCHEIDWLDGSLFSKVHLLPTFGVVECCHPNEVQTKLAGFPIDLLEEEKTTKKYIPTVQEKDNYEDDDSYLG